MNFPVNPRTLVQGFNLSLIGLVHEVYKFDGAVLQSHTNERRAPWHQLHGHWQRGAAHLNSLDHLMQLKISDEKVIALSDEAQMQSQVIVGEDSLTFMHWIDFIVNQVPLGH